MSCIPYFLDILSMALSYSNSLGIARNIIFLVLIFFLQNALAIDVDSTILIIAPGTQDQAASILRGYGIPYQVLDATRSTTLPQLSSSTNKGNFGGIVIVDTPSIKSAQWQQLYDYQTSFGVRMVRLNAEISEDYGVSETDLGSCCDDGVEQLISLTDTSQFPTAGLKVNAGVSTNELYHNPATITDSSIATEIAQFAPGGPYTSSSTAAVINNIDDRQQMVWFIGFSVEWSPTSNLLSHAWVHWITRGLYTGFRRIYLNTQVDDIFLTTDMYDTKANFRLRQGDLDAHKSWTSTINGKMNSGSSYFMELAHNGNGNIINGSDAGGCTPRAIEYTSIPAATDEEFQKPLGTGTDIWPPSITSYPWSLQCIRTDPLEQWFEVATNRDTFAHVSHTFTHESLNNATYSDANKEVAFNIQWLNQTGINTAARFSVDSLVPPSITGLHNGDAISAWKANGIAAVVGDNTRPALLNNASEYWALTTTVANNGASGLIVVPRWATLIYYNCDVPHCIETEYAVLNSVTSSFDSILTESKTTNVRHLLALRHDPFMFHQANLRQIDAPTTTIDNVAAKRSLLQAWVETVVGEVVRLTNYPILSLKLSDIAQDFINKEHRDSVCKPQLIYTLSSNRKTITQVTLSASDGCDTEIPLTVPGNGVKSLGNARKEKVGSDPLTLWVSLNGGSKKFDLSQAITV